MSSDILQKLNTLEQIVKSHQHNGSDFTSPLRKQDFQQLGRVALTAAASSIRINIPQKRYIKIVIQWGAKSGASDDYIRFNDSGANYTFINSGGTARTSQTQIDIRDGLNSALGGFAIIEIANIANVVASVSVHTINKITSAATAQTFYQIFGTWVNATDYITRVDLISSNAQTYPSGSEIIILGSKE